MNEIYQKIHRNVPQIKAILIWASVMVCLWGRRTGKSVFIATWLKRMAEEMPRCNLTFLTFSYAQLRGKIFGEIQGAWEQLGWVENVHYWVDKFPPKHLNIPFPYRLPPAKNSVFIYNGSVIKLASMNKNSPSAGDASDGIAVDECREIDGERLQVDILPSITGTNPRWRGKSCYCAKLFVTDKPRDFKGEWVLEYQNLTNPKVEQLILQVEIKRNKLLYEQFNGISKTRNIAIERDLMQYDKVLNKLRLGLTYVGEASTLDNVDVIGVDAIKGLKRLLTERNYRISVLNEDGLQVENNFYDDLDDKKHCYYPNPTPLFFQEFNARNIEILKYNAYKYDWFSDIRKDIGFDISIDKNLEGNCAIIRQVYDNVSRVVMVIYNTAPETYADLMGKVCEVLINHPTKKIRFMYNHTMTAGKKRKMTYVAKECMDELRKYRWRVEDCYVGAAWWNVKTFENWQKAFRGELPMKYLMNSISANVLYKACKATQTLQSESKELKKDKRNETKDNIHYLKKTHIPEAYDVFLQFDCQAIKQTIKRYI